MISLHIAWRRASGWGDRRVGNAGRDGSGGGGVGGVRR